MAISEESGLSRGMVAVIDDEAGIGDIIQRALKRTHDVDIYLSGQQIVVALEEGAAYDAILCDLYMPGMSGRQIYDVLKENWPDQAQKMIFMSGVTTEEAREADLKGVDNVMIRKPFQLKELREAVDEMVNQSG